MRERPILFSGEMVRAILDGRKTQTRRVIKPQPTLHLKGDREQWNFRTKQCVSWLNDNKGPWTLLAEECPYGQPGDRLWVRETWAVGDIYDKDAPRHLPEPDDVSSLAVDYAANAERVWNEHDQGKWRPPSLMPRWASRITLEIESVGVQRVQQITDFDAFREGAKSLGSKITGPYCLSHIEGFFQLWNSINADRGYAWHLNPWVWVITFKRIK